MRSLFFPPPVFPLVAAQEQEWEQELPAEMTEFLEEGGDETW